MTYDMYHILNITFHSRISLTLACPMDLRLYPLDKQVCVLQIASCEYSNGGRGLRGWAKEQKENSCNTVGAVSPPEYNI